MLSVLAFVLAASIAASAFAQEPERRLYRIPEDAVAGHEANQAIPQEERQWIIVEVPRFDEAGNPVEVLACTALIQAEYPNVPGSAPDWCYDDPGLYEGDPACRPPFDRAPSVIEERIEDPTDQISILLHGLGGGVDVDVSCESTGGVGPATTLDLALGGAGPPTHPVVKLCSHPVKHAGQTVCQPQQ